MSLILDTHRCTACGACVDVCPFGVLSLKGETLVIDEGCNLCGACLDVCEAEALSLPETEAPAPRPGVPPDGVWVFAEQRHGELAPVVRELLGEARRLAKTLQVQVAAVLLGGQVERLVPELQAAGRRWSTSWSTPCLKNFWKSPMPRP